MELKKFNNREEFLNSQEFKNKDLSYCDCSNLDLSSLEYTTWENFTFYHTNFTNTNIHFNPGLLKKDQNDHQILEYCDFTNCDLSGITGLSKATVTGSNFTNTRLNVRFYHWYDLPLNGVTFSAEMGDEVKLATVRGLVDVDTVALNPHIPFNSFEIYCAVKHSLPESHAFIRPDKVEMYNEIITKALEEDKKREGIVNRLYNLLDNGNFSIMDKIRFFQGYVSDKVYDEIDFSSIPYFILTNIKFLNCTFNQITLPEDTMRNKDGGLNFSDTAKMGERISYTTIPHIIIPGVNASSWKEFKDKRLDYTCFTMQKNLYLELGRSCNANCTFCRNKFLKPCEYDFNAITTNFEHLWEYLNNVFIGGGEPTLNANHLHRFIGNHTYAYINYFISTNGSYGVDGLSDVVRKGYGRYNINLSRHALEDSDNNTIFGINTIGIEDIRKLSEKMEYSSKLTLVATCFEGGLDTVESLERYIELSDYVGAAVLFQTLHEDLTHQAPCNQIDQIVFDEMIVKLKEQGYRVGEIPIYSTGDYKLIIVKAPHGDKTISFKKYITKEELEKEWYRASKRTFDLSMAPNGDVYQNWHQASDKILIKK